MSRKSKKAYFDSLPDKDIGLFHSAWKTARRNFGNQFTFYLPGMIRYGRKKGKYPGLSITGDSCDLQCDHCKGHILASMIGVSSPRELKSATLKLAGSGVHGILLTGGSDLNGRLPWNRYLEVIKETKDQCGIFLSAHVGFPDLESCCQLKKAGVSQALIDVIGDEETAVRVCHLGGIYRVSEALNAITQSGLSLIPHIVAGLYYGKIRAEYQALELVRHYQPEALVIVVITPLKDTPMAHVSPPSPVEIGRLIATARLSMPATPISLGCERPRNIQGRMMEKLAILAGATRMAIWSSETVNMALKLGLEPRFQATCCSLAFKEDFRFTRP